MIKSRRMRWSRHVAGKQMMREMSTKFWSENLGEITFETLALMENNIKVWFWNKHDAIVWAHLMWLRIWEYSASCYEHGNQRNKERKFCWRTEWQLVKMKRICRVCNCCMIAKLTLAPEACNCVLTGTCLLRQESQHKHRPPHANLRSSWTHTEPHSHLNAAFWLDTRQVAEGTHQPGDGLSLLKSIAEFPPLQEFPGKYHKLGHDHFFPTHNSPIILPFNGTHSQLATGSTAAVPSIGVKMNSNFTRISKSTYSFCHVRPCLTTRKAPGQFRSKTV